MDWSLLGWWSVQVETVTEGVAPEAVAELGQC